MIPRSLVLGFMVMIVIAALGCEDDTPETNQPPVVSLQAGPVEGDTVSYHFTLSWSGSDPDGRVVRYEVAVDPPSEFTEEEIATGGPGIMATRLSGADGAPDTTRVVKTIGVQEVSFDWIHTSADRTTFDFTSAGAESVESRPTGRFLGMHAVYVRAVDDAEATSLPAHVAFTSSTIAPSSRINYPPIDMSQITTGLSLSVRWTGADLDAPGGPGLPVGYLYRVLDLTNHSTPCSFVRDAGVLLSSDGDSGWIYQSADTSEILLTLPVNTCFMLGVRAVDLAGAVEPFVELGRNAFVFRTSADVQPSLMISETSLGTFSFDSQGIVEAGEAAARPFRFTWSATAESYGGTIEAYSYAVDVTDPRLEEPGWSPWSPATTSAQIVFDTTGPHTFSVRARDTAGNLGLGLIRFNIVRLNFDREVLYVDDYPDRIYPNPEQHDSFWLNLFDPVNSGGRFQEGEVSQWDVFGSNDTGQSPLSPDLEQMGRYRLLVWSANGGGYNGQSALLEAASRSHVLREYLHAGGKLWLTGVYTVAATSEPQANGIADFDYPKTSLGPGVFVWDILKIRSGRIENDRGETSDNRFVAAVPADSVFGGPRIYEGMFLDVNKINPRSLLKSIAYVDALFEPISADHSLGFQGEVDSLYVYGSVARAAGRSSPFDYKVCALRWHDPDPAREHGRVQWFGFPMYYFKNDQAQDTFNKSIDWFREESR